MASAARNKTDIAIELALKITDMERSLAAVRAELSHLIGDDDVVDMPRPPRPAVGAHYGRATRIREVMVTDPTRLWSTADLSDRLPGITRVNIRVVLQKLFERGELERPKPGRFRLLTAPRGDAV